MPRAGNPHSVSRKLCVKEWPPSPPLHPRCHLYFCAFLHTHVRLNADGIKRVLLPQSISVFLFYLLLSISRVCGMRWVQTNRPRREVSINSSMDVIGFIWRASPPMSVLTGCRAYHLSMCCCLVFVCFVCLSDVLLILVILLYVWWNFGTRLSPREFHKTANDKQIREWCFSISSK